MVLCKVLSFAEVTDFGSDQTVVCLYYLLFHLVFYRTRCNRSGKRGSL